MTSRPSTGAPIPAVLAIVLMTLGAYVGGYGLPQPSDLRRFLHGWKRMSSFGIRRWYAEHAPNYFTDFGAGDKFWQPTQSWKCCLELINWRHG